jgi:hypothetical protein
LLGEPVERQRWGENARAFACDNYDLRSRTAGCRIKLHCSKRC